MAEMGGGVVAAPGGRGWRVGLLLAAVAYVFWPALRGEFLWDDIEELVQNPLLRDPHGLFRIWFAPAGLDYYPLKTSVQWLQWHLWGLDPLGYHLTNAGLHALSALLLWRLFRKLALPSAWAGALLFAVHPLGVESVAWMAELKNTLSLPPLLLAMMAYLDFDQSRDRPKAAGGALARAFGWFLVSMLCKTSGVMFPCLLLLYAWWKRGRIGGRDALASAPFFALSFLLGGVTFWLQEHRSIGAVVVMTGGLAYRLALAGTTAVFYCCKAVWPIGLLPMYPRWTIASAQPAAYLPGIALAAGAAWAWSRRRNWGRQVGLGLGFFLLTLFPVLGWVPISHMRFAWAMDHLAYLPLVGLAGLAAGVDLAPRLRGAGAMGLVLVVAGLAYLSHAHDRLYRTSTELWSYTVERNPEAWLGHYNLGVALGQAGRWGEAERQYQAATRLNPAYPEAHLNLGNLLRRDGNAPGAEAEYEEALRRRIDYPEAEGNLADLLMALGRMPEAVRHARAVVRLKPGDAQAHNNLGNALIQNQRFEDAIAQYREALRLKPDYAEARNDLGVALAALGRLDQAAAEFTAALALDPASALARDNLRRVQAALAKKASGRTAP